MVDKWIILEDPTKYVMMSNLIVRKQFINISQT